MVFGTKGFFWPLLLAALVFSPQPVSARSLIRDAEIEHTLRVYSDPVFEQAGLNPSAIKMFIINDNSINAFVAGGSNIFVHTGLILATKTPSMLIGTIAHETGHIAGGHLAQGAEKLENAQMGTILSYVLGAAVMAAGGRDAGAAIMTAGQQTAMRGFLSYSRMNEQAADTAALRYLDALNYSSSGLLELLQLLGQHERQHYGSTVDPYALTHPLSKDRVAHIRAHVASSTIPEDRVSPQDEKLYGRMIAKLYGYLSDPVNTLKRYPVTDKSLEARYARAVAYYKMPNLAKSLAELDSLIAEHPEDPFFPEMKGQILYENGKLDDAIKSYARSVELLPDAPLIITAYAQAQLATERKGLIPGAIALLRRSTDLDNSDATTWRLLASAYGKQGDMGMSSLAQAEQFSLEGEPEKALQYAKRALDKLPSGSPSRLRASDLVIFSEKDIKDKKK